MSINKYYIFHSGELLLTETNTLPSELPAMFTDSMKDSLDLILCGEESRTVLLDDTVTEGNWIRLRTILSSSDSGLIALAAPATRALGLLNWHNSHRFCSRCGAPLADHPKETARVCGSCNAVVFPRLSPAVIVLVQKEGKILLARHADRNQDLFSCIAGYVEHGESLEECVKREVFEETGLSVHNIRYAGSQSWPYPDQYMIAFYADWESGEFCLDTKEILEARWCDPDNMPNYPAAGTVAWRLIHGFFTQLSKK